VRALAAALGSPFEVTAAAHVPAPLEAKPITAIRLEGFETSLRYRADEIAKLWKAFGTADLVVGAASAPFWRDMRDVTLLAEPRDTAIWRISVKPSDGPRLVAALSQPPPIRLPTAETRLPLAHLYDWGGGLVWLAMPATGDAGAAAIRAEIARLGNGHATLIRAPAEIRAAVDVFQPLAPAVQGLQARVKAALDPMGIFNYGRMYAGV
jgi:glycolate oxidase FAD binding subunit